MVDTVKDERLLMLFSIKFNFCELLSYFLVFGLEFSQTREGWHQTLFQISPLILDSNCSCFVIKIACRSLQQSVEKYNWLILSELVYRLTRLVAAAFWCTFISAMASVRPPGK
jgi:hypothetical protein